MRKVDALDQEKPTSAEVTEQWKDVVGFEGLYRISNLGRLMSLDRVVVEKNGRIRKHKGRIMSPACLKDGAGYKNSPLSKDKKVCNKYIHVMVLEAFVGPRPFMSDACHNDGNRFNNALENLRWDSRTANHADKNSHGTSTKGERHPMAKINESIVIKMRDRRAQGASFSAIAKEFGVSTMTAHRAVTGKSWSDVK